MPYVVVGVKTYVPWTTSEVSADFDGRTFRLRPGSETLMPTVVLEYDDRVEDYQAASAHVRRFLSALAWAHDGAIRDEMWTGGGFPINVGRSLPGEVTVLGSWRADYLPAPDDEHARLGLALYGRRRVFSSPVFRIRSLDSSRSFRSRAGLNVIRLRGSLAPLQS